MDCSERRERILCAQHLTAPADQETVVQDLCGLQAQFLTAALHGLSIRTAGAADPAQLVKSWTLRGTVHLFSPADLPLFLHEGRTHFLRPVDRMEADEYITLERKAYFAQVILEELGRGPRLREELRAACTAAGMTECEGESVFNAWGGLLRHLAETGQIVHTVSEQKGFRLAPPFTPMAELPARLELAQRYFTHYGPATVRDAAYFFGKPQREIKVWMARLPLEQATVDGQTCFWLPDGRTDRPAAPECLLLPHFDQLMLGYEKSESPFLPAQYLRAIFSRAGIVMAPVLLRGQVAGSWKCKDGELSLTPFRPWSAGEKKQILRTAEGLWTLKKVLWES